MPPPAELPAWLLWMGPVLFLLHDSEEVIWLPGWLCRNREKLAHRFPQVSQLVYGTAGPIPQTHFAPGWPAKSLCPLRPRRFGPSERTDSCCGWVFSSPLRCTFSYMLRRVSSCAVCPGARHDAYMPAPLRPDFRRSHPLPALYAPGNGAVRRGGMRCGGGQSGRNAPRIRSRVQAAGESWMMLISLFAGR